MPGYSSVRSTKDLPTAAEGKRGGSIQHPNINEIFKERIGYCLPVPRRSAVGCRCHEARQAYRDSVVCVGKRHRHEGGIIGLQEGLNALAVERRRANNCRKKKPEETLIVW